MIAQINNTELKDKIEEILPDYTKETTDGKQEGNGMEIIG